MSVVAVIPARGGSKGIPRKNLITFCGKPLISWSIEQASQADNIDSVWVSSDSEEILAVSEQYGARTIRRPVELSGDNVTSESAWLHALDEIESLGIAVDAVVGMQATSPIRTSEDLCKGVRHFFSTGCDSLFSASPLGDFFIWEKDREGTLSSLNHDYFNRKRRQDFAEQYVENGSFYIFTPALIRSEHNRLGGKIEMSLMEFWKSFEIDDLEDVKFCEVMMNSYVLTVK